MQLTSSRTTRRYLSTLLLASGLVMSTVVTGCAPGEADGNGVIRPEAHEDLHSAFPQDTISRLTNTDNGLEVRKWLVIDDADVIAAAFGPFAEQHAVDEHIAEVLRRNGLRMLRLTREQISELRAKIGTTSMDANAWFGQILQWQPMQVRRPPAGGVTIAIDGRVRRIDSGSVQLMIRCWTVPMEDEPRVQLEMGVQQVWARPHRDLRRLVDGTESTFNWLSDVRIDIPLNAGHAYVLMAADPDESWVVSARSDSSAAAQASEPADDAGQDRSGDSLFMIGPEAEAPPTIGQWLLTSEKPQPLRAVYILLPRIPSEMFPAQAMSSRKSADGV